MALRGTTRVVALSGIVVGGVVGIVVTGVLNGWEYFAPVPSFRYTPDVRGSLLHGFWSYQGIEFVSQVLREEGYVYRVMHDDSFALSGVDPVRHTVLRVDDAIDLGESGVMILTFLNDRLKSTYFSPDQIDHYLVLLNIHGISIGHSGTGYCVESGPHVRACVVPAVGNERAAIKFEDTRLDFEWRALIAKVGVSDD